MRLLLIDSNRRNSHICQAIYHYLILSHAFELLSSVAADTASENLEFAKKLLSGEMGSHEAAQKDHERLPQLEPNNSEAIKAIEESKKVAETRSASGPHGNHAASECGAKVVGTNEEAKKASYVINGMIDEYMLNPCKAKIWFVIELCETLQPHRIEIANYELFSSTFKDFIVYFSDAYPAVDWKLLGQFTASDSRTLQAFDLKQVGFGKFIRVELLSHYGNEHYCPISEVKVYGTTMYDALKENESTDDNQNIVNPKPRRRTSAYKVYRNMMTQSPTCGLLKMDKLMEKPQRSTPNSKQDKPNLPKPTQQPERNGTLLKPSIFVDLNNKVKTLEASLKIHREEMEQQLNERLDKFTADQRAFSYTFAAIVIAYLVYKLMLDLL